MTIQFYGLTVVANGTNSAAYFGVNFATGGEFVQGGATIYPTQLGATLVTLYGVELDIESPAASMVSGGATLTTTGNIVAGRLTVSPAVNVDTVLTLYGTEPIGSVTLKAGDTDTNFSFDVSGHAGIPGPNAKTFMNRVLPKKP